MFFITKSIEEIVSKKRDIFLTVLTILCVLVVLINIAVAYTHNPNFDFDESNTIKISKLPVPQIIEVLNHEQNIYGYYFILHGLYLVFGESFVGVTTIMQFVFWLSSVYFLNKILVRFSIGLLNRRFFCFLFLLLPAVSFYVYTIRMYMLVLLLSFVLLYCLILYSDRNNKYVLVGALLSCLVLSLLHLIAGGYALLILGLLFYYSKSNSQKTVVLLIGLLISLILVFLIGQKDSWSRIFLHQGAQYVGNYRNLSAFDVPGYLLMNNLTAGTILPLNIVFYFVVGAGLIFSIYKRKLNILLLLCGGFFVFANLTNKFSQPRHFIFIVPVVFIFIAILSNYMSTKARVVFFTSLLLIFVLNYNESFQEIQQFRYLSNSFCEYVSSVKELDIFIDFADYNALKYCMFLPNNVYMVDKERVLELNKLSEYQVLLEQAKLGGQLFWQKSLTADDAREFRNINTYSISNNLNHFSLVISTQYRYSLYIGEIFALTDYKLESLPRNGVMIFSHK